MSKRVPQVINRLDGNAGGHSCPQQRRVKEHKQCLPDHVDEVFINAMFGSSTWASIQGHRFTAPAHKQDE